MDEGLLSLKWNNHRSSFIHVLSSLRNKESYADVTLACDGKFYPSHKLVLSTCSEYFQEMFQLTNCKHPIIVLKDISKEDLEALLNYMYLGEVNVLQERLTTLIKSAECLKIKGLAVPDDTPEKPSRHKREADKYESRHESKRRCVESDHRRKASAREYAAKSSGDPKYSDSSTRVPVYPSQESEGAINSQSDSNTDAGPISHENQVYIKQESPEFICLPEEDSKEGVRESLNLPFASPRSEEESSSRDGTNSKIEDHWELDDNMSYPDYDPGDEPNYDGNNEPSSSQSDMDQDRTLITSHTGNSNGNKCPHCQYVARDKTNLRKHIFVHTGEKPFNCSVCSYKTTQKSNLRSHCRRVHVQDSDPRFQQLSTTPPTAHQSVPPTFPPQSLPY